MDKVSVRPNRKLRGILEKLTSQGVVHRPLGSLKILSRIHKSKTAVKIILLCLFHCVDIFTNGAKAMAGNTAGALAGIQAMAPTVQTSHYSLPETEKNIYFM